MAKENNSKLETQNSKLASLTDVQRRRDTRRIAINKVGVKDISYPIVVMDKNRSVQHTVARVNMYVDLPHHFKGTHMSRFIEILDAYREKIALDKMETILQRMKEKLGASSAHLEIEFPYFIEKRAPVSGARGLMEYTCTFKASLADRLDFVLGVKDTDDVTMATRQCRVEGTRLALD